MCRTQSVVRKLGEGISPLASRIMSLTLQLMQAAGKTSTVLEDAFLLVGSLASGDCRPLLSSLASLIPSAVQHSSRVSLLISRPSSPSSILLSRHTKIPNCAPSLSASSAIFLGLSANRAHSILTLS